MYVDGPTVSPHRYFVPGRGYVRLCVWYSEDPRELRWHSDDGLLALIGHVRTHLIREGYYREDPATHSKAQWLGPEAPSARSSLSSLVWLFAVIVFLDGVLEATFGNWSAIYLDEEAGLSMRQATLCLSLFWAIVTLGRVMFAATVLRLEPRVVFVVGPLFVAFSLLLLPELASESAYVGIALAALGLSFFFPYAVSLATAAQPERAPAISGLMVAAIMFGIGYGAVSVGLLRDAIGLPALFRGSTGYSRVMAALATMAPLPGPSQLEAGRA